MTQNEPVYAATPADSDASELSQLQDRPAWTSDDVRSVLVRTWGMQEATLTPLVSERDQNWAVRNTAGQAFVLKVANAEDERSVIDLQQLMMKALVAADVPVPQPVPTLDGDSLAFLNGHMVWLITFLPGTILASVDPPPATLFARVGQVVGRVTNALDGFDHPAAHRRLQWDIQQADGVLSAYTPHIASTEHRTLVETLLAQFREIVRPQLDDVELGVIHNDINDHNLLITDADVSGVIDFGDAVHSARINELAIACTYAMLDRPDPLGVMKEIVSGYTSVRPITEAEDAVLLGLVRTRLATSVSISAFQARGREADDYLRVSEAPAWRLIGQLEGVLR